MKIVTHKNNRETLRWVGERARDLFETLQNVSGACELLGG